ncbi:MAG: aminotransferase class V-fold PLP-dependent enzyme [Helicobacter sp.]|nr:aminotransferase class V-fold PLP-dependent enzyme [Helicobacter sp.]
MSDFYRPLLHKLDIDLLKEALILKKGAHYFDWNATSLGLSFIEARMIEALKTYANTHSKSSRHSNITTALFNEAREIIKINLKLSPDFEIIQTPSATAAIKLFHEILGIYISPNALKYIKINDDLPLVIYDAKAHHSSSLNLSLNTCLCQSFEIPLLSDLSFDLEALKQHLAQNRGQKVILILNFASNVTGEIAPYKEIIALIREAKGIVALDIASGLEHFCALESIDCDAIFIAGHKMLGGAGASSALCIKKELLEESAPVFIGGGNISFDEVIAPTSDLSRAYEAGTPLILPMLKTALCFRMQSEIGLALISSRKKMLYNYLLKRLKELGDLIAIYAPKMQNGQNELNNSVISFNIAGISPFKIAHFLSQYYGVQTRAGFSCAIKYGQALIKIHDGNFFDRGFLRVSLSYVQDIDEIAHFMDCLYLVIKLLKPSVKISKKATDG